MKSTKASVTCFMGMSLMLLLSVFFTLLEMVHYYALGKVEPLVSQISIESAFADYNRMLWEDYGILAIDASYGTGAFDLAKVTDRMRAYMNDNAGISTAKNASHGTSLLSMTSGEITVEQYGLLTDCHGVPFMQLAAKEELYETTGNVVGLLTENAKKIEAQENEQPNVDDILIDAKEALSDASNIAFELEQSGEYIADVSDMAPVEVDNPIESVESAAGGGWVSTVLPAGKTLSGAAMAGGERVSKRTLAVGSAPSDQSLSIDEKIFYLKFLIDHYSNFAHPKNHGGLQYELEYMVGGKTTDEENLSSVVNRLMLAREAANFAHIMADEAKQNEAYLLALAMVGFTANEAIIEATKMGIIAAWALAESVLDVRALLAGKRIALMKTAEEWTLGISMISAAFSTKMEAKDCAGGLTYEEYIYGFLLVMREKTLGLRGLDVLEDVLHHTQDYRYVKADQMIYCMKVDFSYEAAPLFLSFVVLLNDRPGAYHFGRQLSMTYIE